MVDEKIGSLELRFAYLDTNFDGTNIETPLVGYVDYSLKESLNPSNTKYTQIYLDENVGIRKDSYLGFNMAYINPAQPIL